MGKHGNLFSCCVGFAIMRALAVKSVCEPLGIRSDLVLVTLRFAGRHPHERVLSPNAVIFLALGSAAVFLNEKGLDGKS
jgi:hypothetical protein